MLSKDQIQYKQLTGYKSCDNCNKNYYSLSSRKCLFCKYQENVVEEDQRNSQVLRKESDESESQSSYMKRNANPP